MSKKTIQKINDFVQSHNYDIRKIKNGRWIDQKCTPDVLTFVVDCIINYCDEKNVVEFTSKDIWMSDYAREWTQYIFKKVDPHSEDASKEYDKFFMQPMKMLANAGILSEKKEEQQIHFKIENREILEYLLNEKDSLEFIVLYVKKVVSDSELKSDFDKFFNKQDSESFKTLKTNFRKLIKTNTKIKGKLECNRIFTKVLNPIAYSLGKKGTSKGHISKDVIKKDELMYNRDNFRDVGKPKGVTRKEFAKQCEDNPDLNRKIQYRSEKAKKYVKRYNEKYHEGVSEIPTSEKPPSLQMHHMFMAADHPELSYIKENVIALTQTQHFSYAHPSNNTQCVDEKYRCKCLIYKLKTIQNDEEAGICEYDFSEFLKVLAIGFDDESYYQINEHDYINLEKKIKYTCKTVYGCVKADC